MGEHDLRNRWFCCTLCSTISTNHTLHILADKSASCYKFQLCNTVCANDTLLVQQQQYYKTLKNIWNKIQIGITSEYFNLSTLCHTVPNFTRLLTDYTSSVAYLVLKSRFSIFQSHALSQDLQPASALTVARNLADATVTPKGSTCHHFEWGMPITTATVIVSIFNILYIFGKLHRTALYKDYKNTV